MPLADDLILNFQDSFTDELGFYTLNNTVGAPTLDSVNNLFGAACLSFNGSSAKYGDAKFNIGDFPNGITMVTWVWFSSITSGLYYITGCAVASGSKGFAVLYDQTTNKFKARYPQGDGSYVTVDDPNDTVFSTLNAWVQVALAWDGIAGAGKGKWYLNGQPDGTIFMDGALASMFQTDFGFHLGRQPTPSFKYLNGKIQQDLLFGRELQAAEVLELYNGGAGLPYPWVDVAGSRSRFQKNIGVKQGFKTDGRFVQPVGIGGSFK